MVLHFIFFILFVLCTKSMKKIKCKTIKKGTPKAGTWAGKRRKKAMGVRRSLKDKQK